MNTKAKLLTVFMYDAMCELLVAFMECFPHFTLVIDEVKHQPQGQEEKGRKGKENCQRSRGAWVTKRA